MLFLFREMTHQCVIYPAYSMETWIKQWKEPIARNNFTAPAFKLHVPSRPQHETDPPVLFPLCACLCIDTHAFSDTESSVRIQNTKEYQSTKCTECTRNSCIKTEKKKERSVLLAPKYPYFSYLVCTNAVEFGWKPKGPREEKGNAKFKHKNVSLRRAFCVCVCYTYSHLQSQWETRDKKNWQSSLFFPVEPSKEAKSLRWEERVSTFLRKRKFILTLHLKIKHQIRNISIRKNWHTSPLPWSLRTKKRRNEDSAGKSGSVKFQHFSRKENLFYTMCIFILLLCIYLSYYYVHTHTHT